MAGGAATSMRGLGGDAAERAAREAELVTISIQVDEAGSSASRAPGQPCEAHGVGAARRAEEDEASRSGQGRTNSTDELGRRLSMSLSDYFGNWFKSLEQDEAGAADPSALPDAQPAARASSVGLDAEANEKVCRICLEDEPAASLIAPCNCRGSAKYVHRGCIDQWRQKSTSIEAATKCGTCGFEYIMEERMSKWLPALLSAYDVFSFVLLFAVALLGFFFLGERPVRIHDYVVASVGFLVMHPRARVWIQEHGFLSPYGCMIYAGAFSGALFFIALTVPQPFRIALGFALLFFFEWNGAHAILSLLHFVLKFIRSKLRGASLPKIVCLDAHPDRRPESYGAPAAAAATSPVASAGVARREPPESGANACHSEMALDRV